MGSSHRVLDFFMEFAGVVRFLEAPPAGMPRKSKDAGWFGTLAVDFDKGSFEWTHAWKSAGGSSLAKDDRRVVCGRRATGESIEVQPDVIVCRGEVRA